MLTHRQRRCLDYIKAYVRQSGGVPPSYAEIGAGLGYGASRAPIHRLIKGLEERGMIRRLAGRWRAIEVIERVPRVDMCAAQLFVFDDESKAFRPWSPKRTKRTGTKSPDNA